jgi:formylglycine-generating enzyme required for sulfatase activity
MVKIPKGQLIMGSPETVPPGPANELRQHVVTLTSGFDMGKFEVTQEQYEAVMEKNPSYFTVELNRGPAKGEIQNRRPVERVSWYDAIVFCNKLSMMEKLNPAYFIGNEDNTDPEDWKDVSSPWNAVKIKTGSNGYRLPTEAQWEYACRAGTTTAYNTGNTVGLNSGRNTGWYGASGDNDTGNSGGMTHQVGLIEPPGTLEWKLYDMHGNVFEWCWDWYSDSFYSSLPVVDPTGPDAGTQRVRRGGAWNSPADRMRSAYRSFGPPNNADSSQVGFRVVRPSKE